MKIMEFRAYFAVEKLKFMPSSDETGVSSQQSLCNMTIKIENKTFPITYIATNLVVGCFQCQPLKKIFKIGAIKR